MLGGLLTALIPLTVLVLFTLRSALAENSAQTAFATPKAAVDALVAAAKGNEPKAAVSPILGPDADKILSSGDVVADDNARRSRTSENSSSSVQTSERA